MNDSSTQPKPRLAVLTRTLQFILPYIRRRLPEYEVFLASPGDETFAKHSVMLLSAEEPLPDNIPAGMTVLVCMHPVGTGMNGLPMTLAEGVATGRFFHIIGNEARISTVHATDVAEAVALSLGDGGRYFISDGTDPTFDELADALASRINDKRILTLKPWQARWLMPGSLRKAVCTPAAADCSVFPGKFAFRPTPVTEYLRTHIYDESSL